MKKYVIPTIATIAAISAVSIWGFSQREEQNPQGIKSKSDGIVQYASASNSVPNGQAVDFSAAAEQSVQSVVHITTKKEGSNEDFFGFYGQAPAQMGSGSGVIISKDGYIVTNNHVVQGVDEVKVTFNNRITKTAKVIGTDPATDLAVLKIDGNNYPYMVFGNSDDVKLGQWVLAVGYPLNLDATVTAGIVSAKSRHIGINRRNSNTAIESFIQTDAAVNMGNSGGALVNTNGLLVGINSAIATPTGTYAGYSYAIPSNLVRKVVKDIIDFGDVQRGFIGASLIDLGQISEEDAARFGVSSNEYNNSQGVLLADVIQGGGAEAAGLKKGDIVTSIDDIKVNSTSQLMEKVAQYYPGDNLKLNYIRNGRAATANVTLKSKNSTEKLLANNVSSEFYSDDFGAGFKAIDDNEKKKYGIQNGVKVTDVDENGLLSQMTNIQKGFVITKINGENATSVKQVQKALQNGRRLSINGTYPGTGSTYSFSFNY